MYIINKKVLLACLLSVGILAGACDKESLVEDTEQYTKVYMPQAARGSSVYTLVRKDSVQSIVYGAAYGSLNDLNTEMTVEFEVNAALAEQYNQSKGTAYPLLPEASYTLSANSAVIRAGNQSSEPLKLMINPKNLAMETTFLLPISLKSVSEDIAINEDLRTTYFLVEANPEVKPFFDRANWEITDVSAEEVSGEGPDNGHAIHAIDGDVNTFWHTQWAGAEPGLPHHITIDMKSNKLVSGFSFTPRQNASAGRPNTFFIELSEDGENWYSVVTFPNSLPDGNDSIIVFLNEPDNARYFRMTITGTYGGTNHTHMSEINAF